MPLDSSWSWFSGKCPRCGKHIILPISGYFHEGWNLRTEHCKHCQANFLLVGVLQALRSPVIDRESRARSLLRCSGIQNAKRVRDSSVKDADTITLLATPPDQLSSLLSVLVTIFLDMVSATVLDFEETEFSYAKHTPFLKKLKDLWDLLRYLVVAIESDSRGKHTTS